MTLIGGIDEAGRGPCLGPMVICAVSFEDSLLEDYSQLGIKDSKQLTIDQRISFSKHLLSTASQVLYFDISASIIDAQRSQGVTLNELEYQGFADLLSRLNADLVYIDSPDVKPSRLKARLAQTCSPATQLIVEHRADQNYVACGAASILAKVRRDTQVYELQKKYGNFGSGYPSDPLTQEFLQNWSSNHSEFPSFIRSSWETCKKLLDNRSSTSLMEFSDEK